MQARTFIFRDQLMIQFGQYPQKKQIFVIVDYIGYPAFILYKKSVCDTKNKTKKQQISGNF